jgi:predicted nuclease of predicted toxin-antitoxin system
MKIFVDENIPLMTVRTLREMGHIVTDIRNTPDKGMTDDTIWAMVQREKQLLITTDKGFAQYRDEQHHGILIVRLRKPNRHKIHQRVMKTITQFSEKKWPGMLIVMRDTVQSVWRSADRK